MFIGDLNTFIDISELSFIFSDSKPEDDSVNHENTE